jgi:predicted metal-dependent phosphoesterase TrpH
MSARDKTPKHAAVKVDLHCHSHCSDGKHSIDFLAQQASDNGVTHLAITDHDYVHTAFATSTTQGVTLINGVEISCDWHNLELHVVGLLVDPACDALQNLLVSQQSKRRERMTAMDGLLTERGIPGLMQSLGELPAVSLSRSHVADFLVTTGASNTRQKAFKQFLGKKGKVAVAPDWCSMHSAIEAIHAAGGIAILAHPGRYPVNRRRLTLLVEEFKTSGGDALECAYPNIAVDMQQALVTLARDHQLYLSAGSDFHDAGAKWTDIGKFPSISVNDEALAVWHHPRWISEFGHAVGMSAQAV